MRRSIVTASLFAALAFALPSEKGDENDENDENECRRGPTMQLGSVAYFEIPKVTEACAEAHVYFLGYQNEVVGSQYVNITNSTTPCKTNLLQAISLPAELTSAYAKVTFLCGDDAEPRCQMIRLLPPGNPNSAGPSSLAMSRTCIDLDAPPTNPATNPASSAFPTSPTDWTSGVAGTLTSTSWLGGSATETATDGWGSTGPGGSLPTLSPTDGSAPLASGTAVTGNIADSAAVGTATGTATGPSTAAVPTSSDDPSESSSENSTSLSTSALSGLPTDATNSMKPSDVTQGLTSMTTFVTLTTSKSKESDTPQCTCQA